jgi:hypothetical protein
MLRGLLVPGRCAEICHHHGLVGTSTAGADNRTSGLPHKRHIDGDLPSAEVPPTPSQSPIRLRTVISGPWGAPKYSAAMTPEVPHSCLQ